MKMTEIKTANLRLSPSLWDELPALETLYRLCGEYFAFDPPPPHSGQVSAERHLRGEILPPGGNAENQTHFSVWSGGRLIGYFNVDLCYPAENAAYISILFIISDARKNGAGREIVSALKARLAEMGFKYIRLGVSLRNWAALAFWLRQGFDKITKLRCEGDIDIPGRAGIVELEYHLARGERYGN